MTSKPEPDSLTIRPATGQDCQLILTMIRELANYERLSHEVEVTEALLQRHLFSATPAAEVIIAEAGDTPVGYALFFVTYSTFTGRPGLYLEDIFVRPDWRRRGFGKRLFQYVIDLCKTRGYGRLEWSVLNWNQPAIDFYRGLGAVAMDEWTLQRISFPPHHQG